MEEGTEQEPGWASGVACGNLGAVRASPAWSTGDTWGRAVHVGVCVHVRIRVCVLEIQRDIVFLGSAPGRLHSAQIQVHRSAQEGGAGIQTQYTALKHTSMSIYDSFCVGLRRHENTLICLMISTLMSESVCTHYDTALI